MKSDIDMDISTEVQQALKTGLPIVALESTIISHGMPFPQNLKTALTVEKIIREESAVPATIAILNGRIKIGLSQHELEQFAKQTSQIKVSRRDLPLVISQKQSGGTTVAATMICAKLAGIAVFVTGGIGGVHRESENTMDISADLMELAQTNEILLSLRQIDAVIVYKTEEFPAFYTPSSGSLVQSRLDTPEEIAHCMKIKWKLGLDGGIVIGNPVQEQDAMDASIIQQAISEALRDAAQKQIEGKNVTPFLLERINRLTMGESLKSNISLVCNNAHLGAKIAVAYQTQR